MLREAMCMLLMGVTLALVCGVPLVLEASNTRLSERASEALLHLALCGMFVAGMGAMLAWLEVLEVRV